METRNWLLHFCHSATITSRMISEENAELSQTFQSISAMSRICSGSRTYSRQTMRSVSFYWNCLRCSSTCKRRHKCSTSELKISYKINWNLSKTSTRKVYVSSSCHMPSHNWGWRHFCSYNKQCAWIYLHQQLRITRPQWRTRSWK